MKIKGREFGCGSLFLLILIIIAGVIFGFYVQTDNWTARSPARIVKEAGFNLPSYKVIDSNDNMDRTSSSWSCRYWKVKTRKPFSKKDINKLKKLCDESIYWTEYEDYFTYEYNRSDVFEMYNPMDKSVSIDINLNGDVSIRYEWYDFFS